MNKEMTDEYIDTLMSDVSVLSVQYMLAAALKAERAKPKVWDGSPEWATRAYSTYYKADSGATMQSVTHTRELPKSRARIIAEKYAFASDSEWIGRIEAAINEALEGI